MISARYCCAGKDVNRGQIILSENGQKKEARRAFSQALRNIISWMPENANNTSISNQKGFLTRFRAARRLLAGRRRCGYSLEHLLPCALTFSMSTSMPSPAARRGTHSACSWVSRPSTEGSPRSRFHWSRCAGSTAGLPPRPSRQSSCRSESRRRGTFRLGYRVTQPSVDARKHSASAARYGYH